MNRAATALLTASALASLASPAQAQGSYVLPPPPPVIGYPQPAYAPPAPPAPPAPMAAPIAEAPGYADPGYPAPAYPQPGYPAPAPYGVQGGYAPGLPPVASVGYTRGDRDQWLKDCRLAYEGAIKKDTAILGGIVGAIGGGFIGHHETHGTNLRRVGGTLIGAGVGGLVGLALGAVIGGAFEKKKKDQCEAYLERYQGGGYLPGPEAGFGYGWQRNINWGQYGYGNYGYGYGGYTTVMVPVQIGAGYTYGAPIRTEIRYVVEDVVEEVVTAPRTKYVRQAPARKYVPVKSVKDKRVRYTK